MGADETEHFQLLSERELDRLGDEALVDYIGLARAAGDDEAAKRAAGILAWAFWDQARHWVRKSVPAEDVEDVAMEVMGRAVKNSFDGTLVGQFGAWLKTIAIRASADYWRVRERRGDADPLGSEHLGSDDSHGREEGGEDGGYVLIEYMQLFEERLDALDNDLHRRVVLAYGPVELGCEALSAAVVVEQLQANGGETTTEANVHQIWRRFKAGFERALRDSGVDHE